MDAKGISDGLETEMWLQAERAVDKYKEKVEVLNRQMCGGKMDYDRNVNNRLGGNEDKTLRPSTNNNNSTDRTL